MAMAKKKFEVSLEEMNIEMHRQVDVNSDNFKNMNCQSHQNTRVSIACLKTQINMKEMTTPKRAVTLRT
jgi:hypothetical protein